MRIVNILLIVHKKFIHKLGQSLLIIGIQSVEKTKNCLKLFHISTVNWQGK